jgi:hypothetical protein
MNTKSFLVCFIVVMLATSMATAGTHHGHFGPAQGGFARNGTGSFHGGNWNGRSGSGNWNGRWGGGNWHRHHHHGSNDFVFVGSFGFPFLGYPYGYGYYPYSYGYSPYGYGYGSGYYGYGSDYYGYGAGYGNGYYRGSYYPGHRYGYNGNRSGVVRRSSVVRLQQQLSHAGYYRGPIDGIVGTRTRYALRAYQHDHGRASLAND